MDDPSQSKTEGRNPGDDPQRTTEDNQETKAPQPTQKTNHYTDRAKNIALKYVFNPIGMGVAWLDGHNGLVTALSTVAIAVLTYFVAVYANGQLDVFRSQLEEMHSSGAQTDALIEIYKKQAGAAAVQAQAAKDTAIIARENLIAGQRAWVAPIQFSFVDLNNTQQPLRVRMTYQNVGREPARNVRNFLYSGYIRNPLPPTPKDWGHNLTWFSMAAINPQAMCRKVTPDINSVVYPSATVAFTLEIGDPPEGADVPLLFDEVKNKKSIYFVAGCLSYETVKERKNSAFCAMLIPIEGKEISQWQFGACPVGNDDF
jgi:hypothetical protein